MTRGERSANARGKAGERGEGAVDHLAVILLIALIAGALVTVQLGGVVAGGLKYAICRVVHAGDAGRCEAPSDRNLRPGCLTFLAANSYGGAIEVLIFKVGRDYAFVRTTTIGPDGTKTVTITAIKGGTIGAGTGVGVGVNVGDLLNAGADAKAEGYLRLGLGTGWQFTGPDAERRADEFERRIRKQYGIDAVKENGGLLGLIGGNIYDAFAGPDIPDPQVRRFEAEVDLAGSLTAMAGLGPPDPKGRHRKPDRHTAPGEPQPPNPRDGRGSDAIKPNARAWVGLDLNEKAVLEINRRTGETSVTHMLKGEVNYGANAGVDGPQGRRHVTGAITLTRKDGKLTKVTFVQTRIVNGRATVVTTELPLRDDHERWMVAAYLLNPTGGGPKGRTLGLTWDDMAPTRAPGPGASPLQRLLYERAKTSKVEYEYDQSDSTYGASVKLGLKIGASVALSDSTRRAIGAHYLGAPRPDGTRPYLAQPECRG